MMNMLKRQQLHQDEKMSAWDHLLVLFEWLGNPHTTGKAAAGPQNNIINRYSEIVAHIDSRNLKKNASENKTLVHLHMYM